MGCLGTIGAAAKEGQHLTAALACDPMLPFGAADTIDGMNLILGAVISAVLLWGVTSVAECRSNESVAGAYRSPYSLTLTVPRGELFKADSNPPRNDPRQESATPYDQWYGEGVLKRYRSWGPRARQFPAIANHTDLPLAWKQQRLLAVAERMIGLPYQHHHIPGFDPPPTWPWKPVSLNRQSKGLDCSNFTSWVYNYGLGIKLITDVVDQSNAVEITGPGGEGRIVADVIRSDGGYDALVGRLEPGDLLYITNRDGKVSHVVMWVGAYGRSPDGAPLIIDCTDQSRDDAGGNAIPRGVQLRPFLATSWYFKHLSHAHRILR